MCTLEHFKINIQIAAMYVFQYFILVWESNASTVTTSDPKIQSGKKGRVKKKRGEGGQGNQKSKLI